jgi:hypothetical protein
MRGNSVGQRSVVVVGSMRERERGGVRAALAAHRAGNDRRSDRPQWAIGHNGRSATMGDRPQCYTLRVVGRRFVTGLRLGCMLISDRVAPQTLARTVQPTMQSARWLSGLDGGNW